MPERVPRLEFTEEDLTSSQKVKKAAEIAAKKGLKAEKTRKRITESSGVRLGLQTLNRREQESEGTARKRNRRGPKAAQLRSNAADQPKESELRTDEPDLPEISQPDNSQADTPDQLQPRDIDPYTAEADAPDQLQPRDIDPYVSEADAATEPVLYANEETEHPEHEPNLTEPDKPKRSKLHTETKNRLRQSRVHAVGTDQGVGPRFVYGELEKPAENECRSTEALKLITLGQSTDPGQSNEPGQHTEPEQSTDDLTFSAEPQLSSTEETTVREPRSATEESSRTGRAESIPDRPTNVKASRLQAKKAASLKSKLQTEEPNKPQRSKLHDDEPRKGQTSRLISDDTGSTGSTKKSKLRTDETDGPKQTRLIQEEMKPPPKRRQAVSRAAAAVSGGVRHEIANEDKDDGNVGTESMLHLESAAEHGAHLLSDARYAHRLKPYREAARAERAADQANVKALDELSREQYPEFSSNPLSRMKQKEAIKRSYAAAKAGKAAGDTITASEVTRNAAETVSKGATAGQKLAETAAQYAPALVIAGVIILLVLLMLSVLQSCTVILSGTISSFAGTSYTAESDEILSAEGYYLSMEDDLYTQINSIETTYPDYEEYEYEVDPIGHDPHQLAAYLTVMLDAYTAEDAKPYMDQVFAAQYELTVDEIPYGAYDYTILRVTLTTKTIDEVAEELLDDEAYGRYQAYVAAQGLQPDVFDAGTIPPDVTEPPTTEP